MSESEMGDEADDWSAVRGADRSQSVDPTDLTIFQRDVLVVLARADGQSLHGLGIRSALMEYDRHDEVNYGKLYPALDDLAERGLIEKSEVDGRTNSYALTLAGLATIEAERDRLQQRSEWITGIVLDLDAGDLA